MAGYRRRWVATGVRPRRVDSPATHPWDSMTAAGMSRARPILSERWAKPTAAALTIVLLGLTAIEWTFGWFGPPNWRSAVGDLTIYTEATRRVLDGGSWFLARQLAGPYEVVWGDVLYPPTTSWFFLPWLVLPAWTFVVIPSAISAWVVARHRPTMWAWPLMALCLLWPVTGLKVLSASPNVWVMAAVAMGTLYGWPAALVLMKPTLLPFATFGIRSRAWWLTVVALAALTLPFLPSALEYPRVLLDSRGGGVLYSLWDVPLVLIPVIAWLGRKEPVARPGDALP